VLEDRREVRGQLVVRGDREGEAVLLLLLEGLRGVDASLVEDAVECVLVGWLKVERGGGGKRLRLRWWLMSDDGDG